jgi:hypothetical protein
MTQPLDAQDKAALYSLDSDFVIAGDTAKVAGNLEIEVVREAQDRLCITINFPGGEKMDVRILRVQLLRELGIESDEDA